jgi:hypothetical protein
MVKLAPSSIANDAVLRLGVVCEVLNLFVCPLLLFGDDCKPCVLEVHVQKDMCPAQVSLDGFNPCDMPMKYKLRLAHCSGLLGLLTIIP